MTLIGSFKAGPSPRPPPADTAGPCLHPPFMAVGGFAVDAALCVRQERCGAMLDIGRASKITHAQPRIAGSLPPLPRGGARTPHRAQQLCRERIEAKPGACSRSLLRLVGNVSLSRLTKFKPGFSPVPLPFVVEMLSSSYVRCTQRSHWFAIPGSTWKASTSAKQTSAKPAAIRPGRRG